MIRFIQIIILLAAVATSAVAQNLLQDNLTRNQWTSGVKITNQTISQLKEIELFKVLIPLTDTLKKNVSVWSFNNGKLMIVNYNQVGLARDTIKCTYKLSPEATRLIILHYSQDSSFWEFSIGAVSSGNYILLTRRKEK